MAEENETTEDAEQLNKIQAVNEAVLKNLEVRVKRDDEKVNAEEKRIKALMEKVWYKNLGGINQAIIAYMAAATDLNVTHLSVMMQQREYIKQLNEWIKLFENSLSEIQSLQELNGSLSIQLKEIDKDREKLKKELEQYTKESRPKKGQKKTEIDEEQGDDA